MAYLKIFYYIVSRRLVYLSVHAYSKLIYYLILITRSYFGKLEFPTKKKKFVPLDCVKCISDNALGMKDDSCMRVSPGHKIIEIS